VTRPDRPRLAARARLRFDRHAARWMLLYPERGLVLNDSAASVARLLTGERSVDAIVETLAAASPHATRAAIARDVAAFLDELGARRLLEDG
jgi:coenzyme PQQ biosynthesis protein PqqD